MKILIVKNKQGKTKEEVKPFAMVGPVPDDVYILNEQDNLIYSSKIYKMMVRNQKIIDSQSCPVCGYLLDYSYSYCFGCGFDYCPF